MKKKFILSIIGLIFLPSIVYAMENDTITNSNGINITQKEFNFINSFYGDNYFDFMTHEDYLWLEDLDINNNDIEIKVTSDNFQNSLRGTTHQTTSKKIAIAKSCSSICTILVNATWLKTPSVRSYDVIGARIEGTTLISNSYSTKLTSTNGTEYFSDNVIYSNGFGTSVKLPNSATNIRIEQKFKTSLNGNIFASYQHAKKKVTLATSKLYTINSSGYGGVFDFYGKASSAYDQMQGVNIKV